ncbi:macro domain-containing protein [Streptomyces prunicolor]|uniref:macro domain-containing protein n=1 Tax=Streptomyces prunicolor TaxID=67348 RepID=UPI00371B8E8B
MTNVPALSAAALLLTLGIGMVLRRVATAAEQRPVVLVVAWLCVALGVDLILFAFFPGQEAISGKALGFRMSGAVALFLVVWQGCFRVHKQALALDRPGELLRQSRAETARLRDQLAAATAARRPEQLTTTRVHRHPVAGRPDRELGIITGDLKNVDFVDVWVNSENTDMQMSRFHERSVSGLIRYEGARHDASGRVVEDCVADELAYRVAGHTPVMPGTAISTGPGKLATRNKVRRVVHVASVIGEPGNGYRQARALTRCVTNALREAERAGTPDAGSLCEPPVSIVFPLLGAGEAGADPVETARAVLTAAYEYLSSDRPTSLRAVYVLAYTDAELAACRGALEPLSGSGRTGR